ncbi:hypothetical protein DPEC_G00290280, partial [Dallia pectoralis]
LLCECLFVNTRRGEELQLVPFAPEISVSLLLDPSDRPSIKTGTAGLARSPFPSVMCVLSCTGLSNLTSGGTAAVGGLGLAGRSSSIFTGLLPLSLDGLVTELMTGSGGTTSGGGRAAGTVVGIRGEGVLTPLVASEPSLLGLSSLADSMKSSLSSSASLSSLRML